MYDRRMQIKKITLLAAIIWIGLLAIAPMAKAAKASATSHLYLTILPAIETFKMGEETAFTQTGLTKTLTLALRSNTSWTVSYQPVSSGFISSASCSQYGAEGLSNGQAGVGNGIQLLAISCFQPRSWADSPDATLDIVYQTSATPDW